MRVRSLLSGIVTAVVLGAVALGAMVVVVRSVNAATHTVQMDFPTASGLVPGSDVYEAGAKIGTITEIQPLDDQTVTAAAATDNNRQGGHALITVSIEDAYWPFYGPVSAEIRPKSLLGEKYVQILSHSPSETDAQGRTTEFAADWTLPVIHADSTSTPVELDSFINSLQPDARSAAKTLLQDLGAGVAGRGPDLNSAIASARGNLDNLARTGQTLANRDPELDRIIVGLDGVLGKLTQSDQLTQLSGLISSGQQVLNAIEAEKTTFVHQFTDTQAVLADLNQVLSPQVVASLRDTIQTLPGALSITSQESTVLSQLNQQLGTPVLLQNTEAALLRGPTALGGALETIPGKGLRVPITRICLRQPDPAGKGSCEGNGFPAPSTTPVPTFRTNAPAPAPAPAGAEFASFTAFLGV